MKLWSCMSSNFPQKVKEYHVFWLQFSMPFNSILRFFKIKNPLPINLLAEPRHQFHQVEGTQWFQIKTESDQKNLYSYWFVQIFRFFFCAYHLFSEEKEMFCLLYNIRFCQFVKQTYLGIWTFLLLLGIPSFTSLSLVEFWKTYFFKIKYIVFETLRDSNSSTWKP